MKLAKFVAIDGLQASGTTTFSQMLMQELQDKGIKVTLANVDKWIKKYALSEEGITYMLNYYGSSSLDYKNVEECLANTLYLPKNQDKRLDFLAEVRDSFDKDIFLARELMACGEFPPNCIDELTNPLVNPDIILGEMTSINLTRFWKESVLKTLFLINEDVRKKRSLQRSSYYDTIENQQVIQFKLFSPIVNSNIAADEYFDNNQDDFDERIRKAKASKISSEIILRL